MEPFVISLSEIKREVAAFCAAQNAAGAAIKRGHAYEKIARKYGFANWRACRAACARNRPNTGVPFSPSTSLPVSDITVAEGAEAWIVRRTSNLSLRFKGSVLGEAEGHPASPYYWRVTIYRTVRGKYVVEQVDDCDLERRLERKGEVFSTAADMVEALRLDDGTLPELAGSALSRAASKDALVASAVCEDLE